MEKQFSSFSGFSYSPALPFKAGITRRGPSPVIAHEGHLSRHES